jgi:hypothetical protein
MEIWFSHFWAIQPRLNLNGFLFIYEDPMHVGNIYFIPYKSYLWWILMDYYILYNYQNYQQKAAINYKHGHG